MTTTSVRACTKISFPSEALAWRRLFEIALLGHDRSGTRPVATYYCHSCGAWHLTRRQR